MSEQSPNSQLEHADGMRGVKNSHLEQKHREAQAAARRRQTRPLLLLEHLESPELYQALEEAFLQRQETIEKPKRAELQSLVGTWWFDAEQNGFLLDYQCAQMFGFSNYYRRYSIEEISKTLTPQDSHKLFFDFFNPESGDVLIENIAAQVGPYAGERLVVQGAILERDESGQVLQATGSVCYAHSAPATYVTRELNGDGIFYINSAEDFILTSSSYHTMLGYIKGDFPHSFTQFVEQLVHPDDQDNLEIQRHVMESPDYGNIWSCCLRLKHKNGHYIWTIGRGLVLRRNEKGEATVIVGSRSDINLVHQNFEHMHQLLFNDNLTGLYNRTYLEQNMACYAEDILQPMSVLFVDVTGLKITNDILGHNYGDFLLLKLSELLLCELLHFIRELRNPEQRAQLLAELDSTAATTSTTSPAPDAAELPAFVTNTGFERRLLGYIAALQEKIESLLQTIGMASADNGKRARAAQNLASTAQQAEVIASDDKSLSEVLLTLPQAQHERISQLLEENASLLQNANMAQSDPLIWALVETALHGREHPSRHLDTELYDLVRSPDNLQEAALDEAAPSQTPSTTAEATDLSEHSDDKGASSERMMHDLWTYMAPLEAVVAAAESGAMSPAHHPEKETTRRTKKAQPDVSIMDLVSEAKNAPAAAIRTSADCNCTGQVKRLVDSLGHGVPVVLRLSGDEFMVLLPHCHELYGREFLRRIRMANEGLNDGYLQLPPHLRPVPLCFGIGMATVGEENSGEHDSLMNAIERADMRMQADKELHHETHFALLKDYFEYKLSREVSMRDERRQVLLNEQERELLRSGRLEQNLAARLREVEFEA